MDGPTSRFRLALVLVLALAATGGSGCGALDMTDPGRFWPFHKEPFTDKVPGLSTPRERMAALERLREKAPRVGPSERERISGELVKAMAHETDPSLRAEIIRTLGYYPTESAAEALRQSLNDSDAEVRIAVCHAWARRPGPEATEVLSRAVTGDPDPDVRMAACRALGETKDPSAKSALGRALATGDPAMQRRAMIALHQVTGKDYGGNAQKWQEYIAGGDPPPENANWVASRLQDIWGAF